MKEFTRGFIEVFNCNCGGNKGLALGTFAGFCMCKCHSPKEEVQEVKKCNACGEAGCECWKELGQERREGDSWEASFDSRFACAYSPTDWTNDSHNLEEVKDWIRTKKALWERSAFENGQLDAEGMSNDSIRTLALQEAASAIRERAKKWDGAAEALEGFEDAARGIETLYQDKK